MDSLPIIAFVEKIVYTATGKYLNLIQKQIIFGTMMDKSYFTIAEEIGYSEGYVKDEGSKLWKLMSDNLNENITKANAKSRLRSWEFPEGSPQLYLDHSHYRNSLQNSILINNYNDVNIAIYQEQGQTSSVSGSNLCDLSQMPALKLCLGRVQEIYLLEQAILTHQLIEITGLIGVGKTTLMVQLVDKVKDNFESVIWRNCSFYNSWRELKLELIQIFNNNQISEFEQDNLNYKLLSYLKKHKCLLILDQCETLFQEGQNAGIYRSGYEKCEQFLDYTTNLEHQSCVFFVSNVQRKSLAKQESSYLLKLSGLQESAKEILRIANLKQDEKWSLLIEQYGAIPLYLKIATQSINTLFNNQVSAFLNYQIIPDDLEDILLKQWQYLSKLEQKIMIVVSQEEQEITLETLLHNLSEHPSSLFKAIQSLLRRNLLEKREDENYCNFVTLPIIKQFINELVSADS
jgi:hypothetical protein